MDNIVYINNLINEIGLKNNFFTEAGANDGIRYSTTLHLENSGWKGLCVEPNFDNYQKCILNRPNSYCIHAALVSSNYNKKTISGVFSSEANSRADGLMSGCSDEHLTLFPEWICDVPAKTLTECLKESNAPRNFDFLSLDVEGYDTEVLNGLDFNLYRPRIIFIEFGKWNFPNYLNDKINFFDKFGYKYHSNPCGFNPFNDPIEQNKSHDFTFIDKFDNI